MMLLIGLVPVLVLGLFIYDRETTNIKNEITDDLQYSLKTNSQDKYLLVNSIKNTLQQIVQDDDYVLSVKDLHNNKINKFKVSMMLGDKLKILPDNIEGFYGLSVFDPNSFETIYNMGVYDDFRIDKTYLEKARTETVVTELYLNENPINNMDPPIIFSVLTPVFSDVGLIGITSLSMDASILNYDSDMHASILSQPMIIDAINPDLYMINSEGIITSKPKFNEKMMTLNLFENKPEFELQQTIPNTDHHTKIFEMMASGKFNYVSTYENFLGESTIGAISSISGTPWFNVIEISENIVFSKLYPVIIFFVSSFVIVCMAVFEIALILSKSITTPINNLSIFTKQIIKGDLDATIPHSNIKEISDLSHSFEEMQKHLKRSSSEIKSAYNEIRLSEEKFRSLYDHSPTLFRTVDRTGLITDCNEKYAESLGYTKEEVINTTIFEYVPNDQIDKMRNMFETWKIHGKIEGVQITMKRKDNTKFEVLLFASGVYDEQGNLIGSNTSIVDLSEIHEAKKEIQNEKLKRLTSIGELSARIAHDLRNPLSVLKNTFELLELDLSEVKTESIKNKMSRIERAITRMNHQVENVLDYVKEKPLKLETTSINSILHYVLERINIPLDIVINLPKDDLKIKCDFEKLEIVFINLITNAIQVMSNKGEINIRTEFVGNTCVIDVEDNGPGVPSELIEKIFDPLFTTRQIGTGLGLPSCKTIVEAHKGTIKVVSSLGKGAIFRIELPQI